MEGLTTSQVGTRSALLAILIKIALIVIHHDIIVMTSVDEWLYEWAKYLDNFKIIE